MAIGELTDEKCAEYRKYLKENKLPFAWVSDMGWSQRGFTANHGCYPVINGADKQHRHMGCIVLSKTR
jgi:hypothetical protein